MAVKGLYVVYVNPSPPRIHNIVNLMRRLEGKLSITVSDDVYDLCELLFSYYSRSRYPESFRTDIDEYDARQMLDRSKECFKWPLTLKK
jgi:HEPN domain-containing protein